MPYYHDIITDQSWQELIQLNKLIPFVLIGGWATYLYTKTLKSKDIDIAIDYPALSALKDAYDVHKTTGCANMKLSKDRSPLISISPTIPRSVCRSNRS